MFGTYRGVAAIISRAVIFLQAGVQRVTRGTCFGITGDRSSLRDVLYFPRCPLLDGSVHLEK